MDFDSLLHQLENANSPKPTYWEDLVSLTDAIISELQMTKETQSQIKDLKEEIEFLEQNSKTPEEMELINEMENLRNDISNLSATIGNLNETNQSLVINNEDLKDQNNTLNNEVADANQMKQNIKNSYLKSKSVVSKMQSEFDAKNKLIQENTEKYQELLAAQKKHQILMNFLEIQKGDAQKILAQRSKITADDDIDFSCYEAKIPVSQNELKMKKLFRSIIQGIDEDEVVDGIAQESQAKKFSLRETSQKFEFKKLHKGIITAMKFGHLQPFLATAGEDGDVHIIDVGSYEKKMIPGKKAILAIDFNSNDSRLITACYDSVIRLYDTKNWNVLVKNADNKKTVNHVEFCSDDSYVACGQDCKIKLYNINKTMPLYTFKCDSTPCYISSSLGLPFLISGHADHSIRTWDSRTDCAVNKFFVHRDSVIQVLCINSTMSIVSLSLDKTIRILDFRTGNILQSIDVTKTGLRSDKVRMQIKNNVIYLGGNGGLMHSWSSIDPSKNSEIQLDSEYIVNLDFKKGTNMMAIGDKKGTIKIFS